MEKVKKQFISRNIIHAYPNFLSKKVATQFLAEQMNDNGEFNVESDGYTPELFKGTDEHSRLELLSEAPNQPKRIFFISAEYEVAVMPWFINSRIDAINYIQAVDTAMDAAFKRGVERGGKKKEKEVAHYARLLRGEVS